MGNLKLPLYTTLLENEVYVKEIENHPYSRFYDIPFSLLTRISRISGLSVDDIVDGVVDNAEKASRNAIELENEFKDARYFLSRLSKLQIKDLAEREESSIDQLKRCIPKLTFLIGETYLRVRNGVVADNVIKEAKMLFKEAGGISYEAAISNADRDSWAFRIRLLDDVKLPNRYEIEYLLDRGVRDSDIICVCGGYRDYEEFANQV